ncbi:APC family permease [Francisella tularensis]|uniref:APC family permease n=1 Tax=Francisella tularensis TaxID=263 RepID=UPI001F18A34D|nr:APC family permease [Francisella tularensis]
MFAAYYASKQAGSASVISWLIGAGMVLILSLLLGEVASFRPVRGLFGRLLTISHNPDMGFVVAISNWVGLLLTIPSEAQATIQYLSTAYPKIEPYIFTNHNLTYLGILCVVVLIFFYGLINYWGVKTLTKFTNFMTIFKVGVPALTAIVLFYTSYNSHNFVAYHNSFNPYGYGAVFSAVVTCGIFYSFYGFGTIATFCSEIKNPKRNIPLALTGCILICLIIYLMLQVAFIGALPSSFLAHGWHQLNFTSPLAQLMLLLNLNVFAICLYIDAAISPSGTATVYAGSAGRIFTGMAQDKQMPVFFAKMNEEFNLSRRSLIFGLLICIAIVLFFRSWQQLMIVVAVFQLLTCVAIPIAYVKLNKEMKKTSDIFHVPCGRILSGFVYLLVSYLIIHSGLKAVLFSLIIHLILFAVYALSYYRSAKGIKKAFASSWSIFFYMILTVIGAYFQGVNELDSISSVLVFFIVMLICYCFLLRQKTFANSIL